MAPRILNTSAATILVPAEHQVVDEQNGSPCRIRCPHATKAQRSIGIGVADLSIVTRYISGDWIPKFGCLISWYKISVGIAMRI